MATQKMGKWEFTDKEIQEQLKESSRLGEVENERSASKISFGTGGKSVILNFSDGLMITFPTSLIKELREASASDILKGYLTASGDAIHWDDLDAHYTVVGLLAGRFGTQAWMKEIGKMGGSQRTPAKSAASRINGLKGGRPRTAEPKQQYRPRVSNSGIRDTDAQPKARPVREDSTTKSTTTYHAKKATAKGGSMKAKSKPAGRSKHKAG